MIKLLKLLTNNHSLYETIIVSANDTLVELFLEKKLNLLIYKNFSKLLKLKIFYCIEKNSKKH